MAIVTVSSEQELIIPKEVLAQLRIGPGQRFTVIPRGDQLILVPVRPIEEARGSLRGMDTDGIREEEDEDRM